MNQLLNELFRARAEELGRWFAASGGALPRVGSDDPHERRLGVWRQKQLRGLRDTTLLTEQERYLDTVAPGWRSRLTGFEVFRAAADDLGRWMSQSGGTAPSRHSDDPHERQLGGWRQRRLHALRDGTLPPEQERHLDEVAARWRLRRRDRETPRAPGADVHRARADDLPGAVGPPSPAGARQPGTERVSTKDGTQEGTGR